MQKNPERPRSNIAQIVSAITSVATVLVAIYAIFFSTQSTAIMKYFTDELSDRNSRIIALESGRAALEREISEREQRIGALDRQRADLLTNIETLERQRAETEGSLVRLRAEAAILLRSVEEARAQSARNEFAYVRERLAAQSASHLVTTWPFNLGQTESRPARRETVWPHYLRFYEQTAASFSENERKIAERVIRLFVQHCSRFARVYFNLPAVRVRTEATIKEDGRIAERAIALGSEITKCMREVREN